MNNNYFEDRLSETIYLIQNGLLLDAEKNLLELIQEKPTDGDLFNLVGITYSLRNLHTEAVRWFEKGIGITKKSDALYLNLGTSFMSLGKINEAIAAFNMAIKINQNSVNAHFNLGNLYLDLEKYEDCIKSYNQALKIKSDFVDCVINKAVAFANLENIEEAIRQYKNALNLEPNNSKIHLNLASLYEKYKRFNEALAHYDRAIQIKPDYPEAWNNKGVIFGELKQYEQALAHYDRAIQIKPDYPEAWNNKGVIFGELKQYEQAIMHYKQALYIDKNLDWSLGNLIHSKLMIADWLGLDNDIKNLRKRVQKGQNATTPFPILSVFDDESLHRLVANKFIENKFPCKKNLGELASKIVKEKINIAYFSSDFSNHPVIYLLNELFELHDRNQFTIYGFNIGSPIKNITDKRIIKSFDIFIEAEELTDLQIAEKSREFFIDIAINLGGHTNNSRTNIFSYRAAPIQVNFLGYPATMGAEYIDYIIADKQVLPESSFKYYSEKVVWMPSSFLTYDSKRVPSNKIYKRSDYGLPENKFIYCCFNNAYKFNPIMFNLWVKILKINQESILWISFNNEIFKKNLINQFTECGISRERIVFAQRIEKYDEYLAMYSLADLFLDTSPYNAHATALDALRGGLPVLTLMGKSFAGRVGASILTALNMEKMIAYDEEEYIKKATELSLGIERINETKTILRNTIKENSFFNSKVYVKKIESFYMESYGFYLRGLPPKNINLI